MSTVGLKQDAVTDDQLKATPTPKDEFIGRDKMHYELSLLQQKIMALEGKLKQSSCIGLDSRRISTSTLVNQVAPMECPRKEPGSQATPTKPNDSVISYALNDPRCSHSMSCSKVSQTPLFHYSKAEGKMSQSSMLEDSPKSALFHSHTNSIVKSTTTTTKPARCLTAARPCRARSSLSNDIPIEITKPSVNNKLKCRHNSVIKGSTICARSKKASENKENRRQESSISRPGNALKNHKKKSNNNESEGWKRKYETLRSEHEKLREEHEELLEKYQASEVVRKQQRKKIRELEKGAMAVSIKVGSGTTNVKKRAHKA